MTLRKQQPKGKQKIRHFNSLWLSYSAFQEAYTQSEYGAGMEQINAQQEVQEFSFVAETRDQNAVLSRTGAYASKLNSLEGKPLGPMKWVEVAKGDTVKMEAFAHFEW